MRLSFLYSNFPLTMSDSEYRLLRDSVLVLQRQLKEEKTANDVLRDVIYRSGHYMDSLLQIIKNECMLNICFTSRRGQRCIQLPIEFVLLKDNNLQLFYKASDVEHHNILLCSSWTIKVVRQSPVVVGAANSCGMCEEAAALASFTTQTLRLQTDDGKRAQSFSCSGYFLGDAVDCSFTITTQNRKPTADDRSIKRKKRCVFLSSFFLKIDMSSVINRP